MSFRRNKLLFLASLLLLPSLALAAPLGRSFTYQGQLDQAGVPVDGTVTLRFSLWDAVGTGDPPTGGTQVGSTQIVADIPINAGLFSAEINGADEFGSTAFDGQARWLQVEVCSDGSCSTPTVLGPRQALTAAPYALGPWQLSDTNITYTGGNVGIGTTTPVAPLDVRGGAISVENLGDQADLLWLKTERSWVFRQEGSGAGASLKLQNVGGGGNKDFIVQTDGLMGIGTTAPLAKLDVRGDIRLGASGEFFAAAGQENLRVVRGRVSAAGTAVAGVGYTVTRVGTGNYHVAYATPFAATPVVTMTIEIGQGSDAFAEITFTSTTQIWFSVLRRSNGALEDHPVNFIAMGPR